MIGYLVIWRMADVAAPYDDLEELAGAVGFDLDYIPSPPQPRHAWEKATNLKRQKLIVPEAYTAQVKAKYSCEPAVVAETKIISSTTRHLVRYIIVKGADKRDKQLDMKSVAVLKYDDDRLDDADKFVGLYHPDYDPSGATNGNIPALIHRMQTEYQRQLSMADGQDVRYKIRSYLEKLSATCLADGTYFIPGGVVGVQSKLDSLQAFILGLQEWKVTDSALTCQVYKVDDDGSAISQRNRAEVAEGVIRQFKTRLTSTMEALTTPDKRGQLATQRRVEQASADFLEIKSSIKLYQETLGEEMQALADMLHMCQTAMFTAHDKLEESTDAHSN
jgi:hypothetical protein